MRGNCCCYGRCKGYPIITYVDKELCEYHWGLLCENTKSWRTRLKLPPLPEAEPVTCYPPTAWEHLVGKPLDYYKSMSRARLRTIYAMLGLDYAPRTKKRAMRNAIRGEVKRRAA